MSKLLIEELKHWQKLAQAGLDGEEGLTTRDVLESITSQIYATRKQLEDEPLIEPLPVGDWGKRFEQLKQRQPIASQRYMPTVAAERVMDLLLELRLSEEEKRATVTILDALLKGSHYRRQAENT